MHAMLFCTIDDFYEYENLLDYNVKGHRTCLVCEENTSCEQLKHGRKIMYLWHQRFLNQCHMYRGLRQTFNGHQEHERSLVPLTSVQIYETVKKKYGFVPVG